MNIAETLLAIAVLFVASWTDVRFRKIPNCLTYSAIGLAILSAAHSDWLARAFESSVGLVNTTSAVAGLLGCFLILWITYLVGVIGGGDVKIGAFLGTVTGLETGMSILCVGHLLAGVFALICIARARRSSVGSRGIPMAVFYSLGTLIVVLGIQS